LDASSSGTLVESLTKIKSRPCTAEIEQQAPQGYALESDAKLCRKIDPLKQDSTAEGTGSDRDLETEPAEEPGPGLALGSVHIASRGIEFGQEPYLEPGLNFVLPGPNPAFGFQEVVGPPVASDPGQDRHAYEEMLRRIAQTEALLLGVKQHNQAMLTQNQQMSFQQMSCSESMSSFAEHPQSNLRNDYGAFPAHPEHQRNLAFCTNEDDLAQFVPETGQSGLPWQSVPLQANRSLQVTTAVETTPRLSQFCPDMQGYPSSQMDTFATTDRGDVFFRAASPQLSQFMQDGNEEGTPRLSQFMPDSDCVLKTLQTRSMDAFHPLRPNSDSPRLSSFMPVEQSQFMNSREVQGTRFATVSPEPTGLNFTELNMWTRDIGSAPEGTPRLTQFMPI